MNNKLINYVKTMSKIFELLFWLFDAAMVVMLIMTIACGEVVHKILKAGMDSNTLTVTGFDVNVISGDGSFDSVAIVFAFLAGIVAVGFAAMICRNLYQIFNNQTPFCKDNIRLVREIGIFAIAVPTTEVIFSLIIAIVGSQTQEVSVDMTTVFFGIVVLCLAQFFKYGAELEHDVDGLV